MQTSHVLIFTCLDQSNTTSEEATATNSNDNEDINTQFQYTGDGMMCTYSQHCALTSSCVT